MVSSGGGEIGAAKLTGEVLDVVNRLPLLIESMTGVKMSNAMNPKERINQPFLFEKISKKNEIFERDFPWTLPFQLHFLINSTIYNVLIYVFMYVFMYSQTKNKNYSNFLVFLRIFQHFLKFCRISQNFLIWFQYTLVVKFSRKILDISI